MTAAGPAPSPADAPPHASPPPAPAGPSMSDCLDLLAGPTDERRLVGLLLATKLLPAAGEEGLASARRAVGPAFLERLLLPLDGPVDEVGG